MNKISFALLIVSIVLAAVKARPQRPPQGLLSEIEARDVENVIRKLEAVDDRVASQLDCSVCTTLCHITHLPACHGCCW